MSKVQILTDSGSDLPLSFLNEHNITLFPLQVIIDEKEYEDVIAINSKTVYDAMREGKAPKTSQVSPSKVTEIFTQFAKENTPCIYIAFSSELSGTYQTACLMRDQVLEEYPNFDITIIDSKCASLGQGLVVRHAAKLAQSGASKEKIIEEVTHYAKHMEHLFTVDDLEYLKRGGRVSSVSAFLGGLLNIKPLLNVEDGKLVPLEKHRGRKKVLNRMIELMEERGKNLANQIIGISHADDEETALYLKKLIEDRFGCKHFFINMIGSTIGAHVGPGTLSVFFLGAEANTEIDLI